MYMYNINEIWSRKHVEIEGNRKPKNKAAFQVISGADVRIWYTQEAKDYPVSPPLIDNAQKSNNTALIL